jgi:hypothetical protein
MADEIVVAEKPIKRRKKAATPLLPLKVFAGNADLHLCRISTGEEIEAPEGFQEAMARACAKMLQTLLQGLLDKQGIEPIDVHIAFQVTFDTEDHPGEKREPEMPARVM